MKKKAKNSGKKNVKLIAFYLPQFHPIPENDQWWGKGFTEWTNVRKARPLFPGHYQPHVPAEELGYYNLLDSKVREKQARMAKEYGIHGFCYYYYWFHGKKILETPLQKVLKSKKPDFPFCVCWANENWTRKWDGGEKKILMRQTYSEKDARDFIKDLAPILRDKRYIKIGGSPVILVYRASLFPKSLNIAGIWRQEAKKAGLPGLYLIKCQTFGDFADPQKIGFDAAAEFPPHDVAGASEYRLVKNIKSLKQNFKGAIFDYEDVVSKINEAGWPKYKLFKAVMLGWDNSARINERAHIYQNFSLGRFKYWLTDTIRKTEDKYSNSERLVFVNAWNEWAEGCHLEPDQKYGLRYLEACKSARKNPEVSVIIPSYNHAKYIGQAIKSVINQTFKNWELIIIDDGSTDNSVEIIKKYDDPRIILFTQSNHDAPHAINRGIRAAHGKYISILNSDDVFEPRKLERCLKALKNGGDFVLSKLKVIDEKGNNVGPINEKAKSIQEILNKSNKCHDLDKLLLNIGYFATTSNFFFKRKIIEKVGYFHEKLHYTHDVDWLIRLHEKGFKVRFIPEHLASYRLHPDNTYRKGGAEKYLETCYSIAKLFKRDSEVLRSLSPDFFKQYIIAQTTLFLLSFPEKGLEIIISEKNNESRKEIINFINRLNKTNRSIDLRKLFKLHGKIGQKNHPQFSGSKR